MLTFSWQIYRPDSTGGSVQIWSRAEKKMQKSEEETLGIVWNILSCKKKNTEKEVSLCFLTPINSESSKWPQNLDAVLSSCFLHAASKKKKKNQQTSFFMTGKSTQFRVETGIEYLFIYFFSSLSKGQYSVNSPKMADFLLKKKKHGSLRLFLICILFWYICPPGFGLTRKTGVRDFFLGGGDLSDFSSACMHLQNVLWP